MPRSPGRTLAAVAVGLIVFLVAGRAAALFYTDALWYDALGQSAVFWTRVLAVLVARVLTGALGAAIILVNLWFVLRALGPVHLRRRYGNLEIAEQVPRSYLVAGAVLVSLLAGWWLSGLQFGGNASIALLAWARSEPWGITDPLFGRDLSFYIFALPVYRRLLEFLLIILVWSAMLVAIGYTLVGAVRVTGTRWEIDDRPRMHFAVLVASLLVVLGMRYLLGRYMLLLDGGGFSGSIGYTDIYARLPARLVLGLLAFAAAGALIYGTVKRTWAPPAAALGVFLVAAIGMGVAYPAVVQKVQVEPNQFNREAEYIRWHIEFTRRAYGLDRVAQRAFPYRRPDGDVWTAMAPVLERLPLWDPEPLRTAFNQNQARRGYYQFNDVDFDRYGPPGAREQGAIGVREFYADGMAAESRTWQTLHLNPLFTRGLGAVAIPAAQKRRGGDPLYWIGDAAPGERVPTPPGMELVQPSVYFGETMTDYAVVGHTATISTVDDTIASAVPVPAVTTGVPLSSFARVFAFAWAFGEHNLLFASELTDTSRIIYRRAIRERVRRLAPFLLWDPNPHPVILDGRILWILDGYTVSSSYPLSHLHEIPDFAALRYIRGSVKATVDAVSGEVRMYALPDPDPILRTYRSIFGSLIMDWDEMPEQVRVHVRYPGLLFGVQADILEEYHLERPDFFYAGQDYWQRPAEATPQQRRRFRPNYMLSTVPGERTPEFLLIQSFIARQRENMTALLIARSDAPHYGELVLLEMPRDAQIKGPSQVHSIIEQDPFIAQQLSLWRTQGNTVDQGRLRVVPTDSSILYIEPLFLSAQDVGIPQLQRLVVSDGNVVAMAEDLAGAVAALGGELAAERRTPPGDTAPPGVAPAPASAWLDRALELVREAEARMRAGDLAGFAAAWDRLKALLEQESRSVPR